jgi:YD repeat-containing protein
VVSWSYDPTYQLTNEKRSGPNNYNITYAYDAVGNRTLMVNGGASTTYAYNAANELATSQTSAGLTTYAFDGDGNMLTSLAPGNQLTTCKCLRGFASLFNPLKMPRDNLVFNSNHTLHCMVAKCGIQINWRTIRAPIGYNSVICTKHKTLYSYGVKICDCVEWTPNCGVNVPLKTFPPPEPTYGYPKF